MYIRLDHPYHLELPSLRRVGRHFSSMVVSQGSSGGLIDLSSLEEVGGHFDIWADLFDDSQVTSLKRDDRLASSLGQYNPFEELQAIASSPLHF